MTHSVRRFRAPVALALVAGLALSACGGSSDKDADASGSTKTSSSGSGATIAGVEVTTDADIAASVPDDIKSAGVLKNITYDNAPPDTFVENGKTVGWEVDIAQAAAIVMGLELETTTSGAFDTFIPGLQNGRYNTSISSLIQTPERLQQIDVVTYYDVGTSFMKKAGSDIAVTDPTDVCGHSVSTLSGSAFADQLDDINKTCPSGSAIDIQLFPTAANATLALSNGRAELYAASTNQLAYIVKQTPGQFELTELSYEPVPEGAGITKGIGLSQPFKAAIDKLIETGAYEAIMKKWGITTGLVDSATVYSSDS